MEKAVVMFLHFSMLSLIFRHRKRYLSIYLPWAVRNAKNGKFLMNVYYEKHWETDLTELRQELNIEPPPPIIK